MRINLLKDKKQTHQSLLGQKGQAAVEYILLIAVIVVVSLSVFKKLEGYIISDPNSIVNTILGGYEDMFGAQHSGLNLRYKRFYIRR